MAADHLDNITINITLDPAPITAAGFGTMMIIADGSTTSLNGDRIRSYGSVAAVQTDVTAGFVSTAMLAAATAAFSQQRAPSLIKIGRQDGVEAFDAALAAIILVDSDFYGICIEPRTASDQVLVSTAVEATSRIFIFQSADTGWKTTGIPAGYATMTGRERTILAYHDTDAQFMDFAWGANRLAFNPDTISAPWTCPVLGVAPYAAAPTDTEKVFLLANNANVGLPYGGATFFIDPGVNIAGRPIEEIETADWFEARLTEAVATRIVTLNNAGRKLPVTIDGQGQIQSLIEAQFAIGVTGGHFVLGETSSTPLDITDGDRAARRLRFSGFAQLVVSARLIEINLNFSRNPAIQ